ncbi:MAG: hypothetical protein JNJ54_32960 [Myxococcaceae bacterium]|nr:hypothetical protein [Myxococcaceae bacterium]
MLGALVLALLTAEPPQCTGKLVPPNGYRQKTVLMPKGGAEALEAAKLEARRQLRENLCTGSDCEGLDQRIIDWVLTEQGDKACATVVIEETDFKAWQNELTAAKVDDQFRVVLRELFPQPAADAGVEVKGKKPKGKKEPELKVAVVVGNVKDDGALGSQRALWIARKMEHALSEAGITQVTPPDGWTGRGVPPNASSALIGDVLTREEKGRPHVDITWTAIFPDGRSKASPYISMLASVAPKGPQPVDKLAVTDMVSVEIEDQASHHGAMCNGQRTQLFVSSKEDRCLLVFDVWGDPGAEKGLLIFPNEARTDCTVRMGEKLKAAGDEGFAVMLDPKFETERFIVVAAPSRAELPMALKKLWGTCALSPAQIAVLKDKSLGVDRAEQSFRVLPAKNPNCGDVPMPDPAMFKQAEQDLKRLAVCKAKENP